MWIIDFFRNTISGTYYVIYVMLLLVFIFAMVGYLFKQKYAKIEFKITTNKPLKEDIQNIKTVSTAKVSKKKKNKEKTTPNVTITNQETATVKK